MVVRRQVEVEKPEQKETEIITLSHYKNDSGFYAIPNEKWQLLSQDDRSFVKFFNGKLRKELENDKRINKRTINARRSTVDDKDSETQESPIKKQRTVVFRDDVKNENNDNNISNGDEAAVGCTGTLNNKRTVLGFTIKNK